MKKRYLLGLDAGSGGVHCLLVDVDSKDTVSSFQSWTHPVDRGVGVFGFQFDTAGNWLVLEKAVRGAVERAGVGASEVIGIAATGMRFGLVLLDDQGREIFATPNRDARAASQSSELARARGEHIHRLCGYWPGPIFAAPRLSWLASKQPDLLERAHRVLNISDWVAFRLCGEAVMDHSQAAETLLADIKTSEWSRELIASIGLPREIFPLVCRPGTRLGAVTEEAEAQLGLKAGTPVAVGGADTQCGLLGGGAISPGQIGIIAGTTVPIQLVLDTPLIDETVHLWTGRHVTDKSWVLESNAGAMGEALQWIAGAFFSDARYGRSPAARMMGDATESPPGAGGMVSTLGTQLFNARELSLPIGSITLSHLTAERAKARCNISRAVVEGMAYSVKANTDQLARLVGSEPTDIMLTGGMSGSPMWSQLLSDVLDRDVRVTSTPLASALGAAICAGVAAGTYISLDEGAGELSRTSRRHSPDQERAKEYRELYSSWQQVRETRAESDEIASGLSVRVMVEKSAKAAADAAAGDPAAVQETAKEGSARPDFRPRMLVTADMDSRALESLNNLGEVEYAPFRKEMHVLSGPDLVDALDGFQVLVTEVDVIDSEAMYELEDLRVIGVCRANPVNIDVNAATVCGIPVFNTPGRNAFSVADLTITFILMLARKLPPAAAFLRQTGIEAGDSGRMGQAFVSFQGAELWHKTIGLVGLGAVGRAVTQRLLPFDVRILVYDPYINGELVARCGAESVDLETLLRESDFVSLHAAVTDETEGLIGARELSIMNPRAFLINTARASLVDEAELALALKSRKLAGAAMDVFAIEPPGSDHPLLALPSVIATPHLAGNTTEVAAHQGQMISDELGRLLRGEALQHVLNPETLRHFHWEGKRESPPEQILRGLADTPAPAVSDLHQSERESVAPMSEVRQKKETGLPGKKVAREVAQGKADDDYQLPRTRLKHIVELFIENVLSDAGIREFSLRRSVTMHFVISDFALEFHLGFIRGEVSGGLGGPDIKAEVLLKMKADILDGIFTGRLNPTRAALSGKISFTGDTVKAMAFQRVQKDLKRLYVEAREEVGDPGDLTEQDAAPAVQAPSKGIPSLQIPSAGTGDIRDEIFDVLSEMYDAGLITSTGGNISARGSSDEIFITPGQIFKGALQPSMMVRLDREGNPLDASSLSPSSERLMHCSIYRTRPDVESVIHSHAPHATMLALADLEFLPISTEAAFIGEIPRIAFIMPGTQELADAVAEAMDQGVAVLMQNHGLIVAAGSLRRAADMTLIIEQTSEMIVTCRKLGKKPPVLPKKTVAMLRELGDLMA